MHVIKVRVSSQTLTGHTFISRVMLHFFRTVTRTLRKLWLLSQPCHMWRGQHITFFTDNVTTRAAVNKGACRHPLVMAPLRFMFWLSVIFDFTLECCFVPRCFNIADTPSRLHEWDQFLYMYQLTSGGLPFCINNLSLLWCNNMSHKSLSFLLDRHSYKYGAIP